MESAQVPAAKFLNPEAIIAQLKIAQGCCAADFGCGPGYFSLPFSQAVGEFGKVYSFDVLPQALETVASKARNSGIVNIVTKRVNLEKANGSGLEADSMDWVILKDMLFQNQNKEIIIAEAYRVLKTGGKVLVIEWNEKESPIGPELARRIPQNVLEQTFERQNLVKIQAINAGDFHYSFVAEKK